MPYKYAASFDFDGCLSRDFIHSVSVNGFITDQNDYLINTFIKHYMQDANPQVFIGSTRQSIDVDQLNAVAYNSGSCFMFIRLICEHLGVTFDKLTLNDIYHGVAPGTTVETFLKIVDESGKKETVLTDADYDSIIVDPRIAPLMRESSSQFADRSKINLLYAQIHKVATDSAPDDLIKFDFFDDRSDILRELDCFFKKNPTLIPSNVTLRLFTYTGKTYIRPIDESNLEVNEGSITFKDNEAGCWIVGKGERDHKYYETAKHLSDIALEIEKNTRRKFHMSTLFTLDLLEERRAAVQVLNASPAFSSIFKPVDSVPTAETTKKNAMHKSKACEIFIHGHPDSFFNIHDHFDIVQLQRKQPTSDAIYSDEDFIFKEREYESRCPVTLKMGCLLIEYSYNGKGSYILNICLIDSEAKQTQQLFQYQEGRHLHHIIYNNPLLTDILPISVDMNVSLMGVPTPVAPQVNELRSLITKMALSQPVLLDEFAQAADNFFNFVVATNQPQATEQALVVSSDTSQQPLDEKSNLASASHSLRLFKPEAKPNVGDSFMSSMALM